MSLSTHYCTTQFNVIDGAKGLSVSPFTSSHSVQNLTWQSWLTSNTTLFSLPTLLNTMSSSTLYFASQFPHKYLSFVAGAALLPISQSLPAGSYVFVLWPGLNLMTEDVASSLKIQHHHPMFFLWPWLK